MKPGPKPKPNNLRLLEGSRSRVINAPETPLEIATDQPLPPPWIDGYALDEWNRLADLLYQAGVLTEADQTMLAAYCVAYQRWRHAEEDLLVMAKQDKQTHGVLLKTKEGNAIQNPLVGAANKAQANMLRLATEFGLSPSSRTLIAGKGDKESDIAARYGLG